MILLTADCFTFASSGASFSSSLSLSPNDSRITLSKVLSLSLVLALSMPSSDCAADFKASSLCWSWVSCRISPSAFSVTVRRSWRTASMTRRSLTTISRSTDTWFPANEARLTAGMVDDRVVRSRRKAHLLDVATDCALAPLFSFPLCSSGITSTRPLLSSSPPYRIVQA